MVISRNGRTSASRRLPSFDAGHLRSFGLSRRELEVLELVAQGDTNVQAAARLGISPFTVKKHLERMYAALGARNRAELIALTYEKSGLVALKAEHGSAPPRHNLAAALTSFLGRERQIQDLTSLLATKRLVTLGGPGGVGKTRLSLEVGAALLDAYPEGVWLVELGDLADPRLVLQTVAAALGVRESGRPRLAALIDELRSKHLLLLLDNCEHLVGACAALVEPLLRACPDVRVLATSRETLGVAGEVFWPVPSLSLPDLASASGATPAAIGRSEAVRLFVERAALRRPEVRWVDRYRRQRFKATRCSWRASPWISRRDSRAAAMSAARICLSGSCSP